MPIRQTTTRYLQRGLPHLTILLFLPAPCSPSQSAYMLPHPFFRLVQADRLLSIWRRLPRLVQPHIVLRFYAYNRRTRPMMYGISLSWQGSPYPEFGHTLRITENGHIPNRRSASFPILNGYSFAPSRACRGLYVRRYGKRATLFLFYQLLL